MRQLGFLRAVGITYSVRFPLVAFRAFLFLFLFLTFIFWLFPSAPVAKTQASPVHPCGAGKPLALGAQMEVSLFEGGNVSLHQV